MIITAQKPLDEILNSLSPYTNVLIAGCDGCTQPPRGLKEANILAQLLELAGKQKGKGFKFRMITVTKQCDSFLTATALKTEIEGIDALLSLGCGVGVQTITEVFPDSVVLPAQNTLFMGGESREEGILVERCAACGDCLLDKTGGICPVTRCAKGLLNGPCGGTRRGGKCEIDPEKDCAWVIIYLKLERQGKLELMRKYHPPKNFRVVKRPGRVEAVRV